MTNTQPPKRKFSDRINATTLTILGALGGTAAVAAIMVNHNAIGAWAVDFIY